MEQSATIPSLLDAVTLLISCERRFPVS